MKYPSHILTFLIEHYSQRLIIELEAGNTKAVMFCRETLFNLKKTD